MRLHHGGQAVWLSTPSMEARFQMLKAAFSSFTWFHCWDHQSSGSVTLFPIALLKFRFCFLVNKSSDVARVFQIVGDCTSCLTKSLKNYVELNLIIMGKKHREIGHNKKYNRTVTQTHNHY